MIRIGKRAIERMENTNHMKKRDPQERKREVVQRCAPDMPRPAPLSFSGATTYPHTIHNSCADATSSARRTAICRSALPILQSKTLGPGPVVVVG